MDGCEGDVVLTSRYGDRYQYITIAALLGQRGDELELFCSKKEDENKFLKFFYENPEVLK